VLHAPLRHPQDRRWQGGGGVSKNTNFNLLKFVIFIYEFNTFFKTCFCFPIN
jgi:hypothetical protein